MATARNKENDTADRKHVLRGPYKGHVDILLCSHSDVCVCVGGGPTCPGIGITAVSRRLSPPRDVGAIRIATSKTRGRSRFRNAQTVNPHPGV